MVGGHQAGTGAGGKVQRLLQKAMDRSRILAGCLAILAASSSSSIPQPTNSVTSNPLADFNGQFWGDSISNNGSRVRIVFDVHRNDHEFTGIYHCSAGNANCRNQMTRGWVRGSTEGRSFRVSLPDSSWCLYRLGTFYMGRAKGEYSCYLDASLLETGTFAVKRSVQY